MGRGGKCGMLWSVHQLQRHQLGVRNQQTPLRIDGLFISRIREYGRDPFDCLLALAGLHQAANLTLNRPSGERRIAIASGASDVGVRLRGFSRAFFGIFPFGACSQPAGSSVAEAGRREG